MVTRLRRLGHRLAKPRTQLRLNGGALAGSAVLWTVAAAAGWLASVTFVSQVSMLALVLASFSGVAASIVALQAISGTNWTRADRRYLDAMLARTVKPVLAELAVLQAEVRALHRIVAALAAQLEVA